MNANRIHFRKALALIALLLANFLICKQAAAQCTSGDCKDGYGVMNYGGGKQYEGQFKDGKKNGLGTNIGKKGKKYIGGYMNDKEYGKGILLKNDKIEKSGYWLNGKFIKVLDPDSVEYKLYGDCQNGLGIYIYKNGDSYTGEWKDGKKSGAGMLFFKGVGTYAGNFANDQRNGFGVMQWTDRGRYEGNWKDGQMDGDGVFYNTDNTVRSRGKWVNGDFTEVAKPRTIKIGDTIIVDSFASKVRLILADSKKQFPILKWNKMEGGIITADYFTKLKLFPDADDEITHIDMDTSGNETHFEYKSIRYNCSNSKQKIDDWHEQIKASIPGHWKDAKLPSVYGYEMANEKTGAHIIIKSNETDDVSVEFYTK